MSDPVLDHLQSIDDLACEYGCEHLSEDDQFKDILGDLVTTRAKLEIAEESIRLGNGLSEYGKKLNLYMESK